MIDKTLLQKEFEEVLTALELILTDTDSCTVNEVLELVGWQHNGHVHKVVVHVAVVNGYRVERIENVRGTPYRIFDW